MSDMRGGQRGSYSEGEGSCSELRRLKSIQAVHCMAMKLEGSSRRTSGPMSSRFRRMSSLLEDMVGLVPNLESFTSSKQRATDDVALQAVNKHTGQADGAKSQKWGLAWPGDRDKPQFWRGQPSSCVAHYPAQDNQNKTKQWKDGASGPAHTVHGTRYMVNLPQSWSAGTLSWTVRLSLQRQQRAEATGGMAGLTVPAVVALPGTCDRGAAT